MTKTISTAELVGQLGNPNFIALDVRPIAAYNGWRLQGEDRGGHIPGAVAFPLSWTDKIESPEITRLLTPKGITRDKPIVVYGYSNGDSAVMIEWLMGLGYGGVLSYEAGLAEWASDENLPMDRLANYKKLVHPEWVHRLINEQQVETYSGRGYEIFHVNFGFPEEYKKDHLPGAIHLDTNVLESTINWNRRTTGELKAALLAHGISHNKTIVLYGKDSEADPGEAQPGRSAGQIAATRAAAILMYAGAKDVRLIDGGYDAWVAAGYEVETQWREPTPIKLFGTQIPSRSNYFVDIEGAKALLIDPSGVLASIRSWPEFIGEISGYNYILPRGRIAGAVWGNSGTDAYDLHDYRNPDNTMRAYHEIEANWQKVGITSEKQVAFYCGTGWRASEAFFSAYLMGWDRITVYDGGWLEWSKDKSNPVERGIP